MTFGSKQNGLPQNDRFLDDAHRSDTALRTGVLCREAGSKRLDKGAGEWLLFSHKLTRRGFSQKYPLTCRVMVRLASLSILPVAFLLRCPRSRFPSFLSGFLVLRLETRYRVGTRWPPMVITARFNFQN